MKKNNHSFIERIVVLITKEIYNGINKCQTVYQKNTFWELKKKKSLLQLLGSRVLISSLDLSINGASHRGHLNFPVCIALCFTRELFLLYWFGHSGHWNKLMPILGWEGSSFNVSVFSVSFLTDLPSVIFSFSSFNLWLSASKLVDVCILYNSVFHKRILFIVLCWTFWALIQIHANLSLRVVFIQFGSSFKLKYVRLLGCQI